MDMTKGRGVVLIPVGDRDVDAVALSVPAMPAAEPALDVDEVSVAGMTGSELP